MSLQPKIFKTLVSVDRMKRMKLTRNQKIIVGAAAVIGLAATVLIVTTRR